MSNDDTPADVDPAEFTPDSERTAVCEAIPEAVEPSTPRPDVTGRHNTLTPAQFASAIDLTDRDAFTRGVMHGRAAAIAEAQEAAVNELRKVREDCVETFRALFVIFEIPHPDWVAAEEWIRRRLTPL